MESVFKTFSIYLSKIVITYYINIKGILDNQGIDFLTEKLNKSEESFDENILIKNIALYLRSDLFQKNIQRI